MRVVRWAVLAVALTVACGQPRDEPAAFGAGDVCVGYINQGQVYVAKEGMPGLALHETVLADASEVILSANGTFLVGVKRTEMLRVNRTTGDVEHYSHALIDHGWNISGDGSSATWSGRQTGSGEAGVFVLEWGSRTVTPVSQGGTHPSLSSNGKQVAFEADGAIVHRAVSDAATRTVLSPGTMPAVSPDGTRVAFRSSSGLSIVSVSSKAVESVDQGNVVGGPVWSPDGRKLLYATHTWRDWFSSTSCLERSTVMIADIERRRSARVYTSCIPLSELYRYMWIADPTWCQTSK